MKWSHKNILNPERLDESDVLNARDVDSHASLLTNRRLDILFQQADAAGVDVWKDPKFNNMTTYNAILNQLFKDLFVLFEPDEVDHLRGLMREFYSKFTLVVQHKLDYTQDVHFSLCCLLDQVHAQINYNMQRRNYFFRTSAKKVRGIEGALKHYADMGVNFNDLKPKPAVQ